MPCACCGWWVSSGGPTVPLSPSPVHDAPMGDLPRRATDPPPAAPQACCDPQAHVRAPVHATPPLPPPLAPPPTATSAQATPRACVSPATPVSEKLCGWRWHRLSPSLSLQPNTSRAPNTLLLLLLLPPHHATHHHTTQTDRQTDRQTLILCVCVLSPLALCTDALILSRQLQHLLLHTAPAAADAAGDSGTDKDATAEQAPQLPLPPLLLRAHATCQHSLLASALQHHGACCDVAAAGSVSGGGGGGGGDASRGGTGRCLPAAIAGVVLLEILPSVSVGERV